MADWVQLVLAAVGGVLLVGLSGLKDVIKAFCARWTDRINRSNLETGLEAKAAYFSIVNSLQKKDFVDRVLLLVGHNGGGIPTAGGEYTMRAFYGYCSRQPTNNDPMDLYLHPLVVDEFYIRMLQEMLRSGRVINTVKDMPEDAMLRRYYEAEGVTQSVLYFLKIADNSLYYLSVGNYSRPFLGLELAQIELAVTQLRGSKF
jgi:hypothetical protein